MSEEWFVIRGWHNAEPTGMIPRSAVEALGIDCSIVNREGTLFFTREQRDAIHAHPRFETTVVEPAPVETERRVITQAELDEAIRVTQAMPLPEFWAAAARLGLKKPGYFHHTRWGVRR